MPGDRLTILYTNIGRGHPFYLDGVRARWTERPDAGALRVADVFECSGPVARAGWIAVRELYRRGGSPGIGGMLYRAARGDRPFDGRSVALRVLGRGVRERFGVDDGPLLVAHPILVAILAGRGSLAYQHGEVAVPAQAIVAGASRVYVPTQGAADAFVRGGYSASRVMVTGLCVEPALADVAKAAYEDRRARVRSDAPLVGGFFSSGAEPPHHVEALAVAACSVVQAGGKAIVVAEWGGRLQRRAREVFAAAGVRLDGPAASLVSFRTRDELDARTGEIFHALDYVVAPPHERTGWALGLGLPMAIVGPDIGPFAPLNRAALLRAGVAIALQDRDAAAGFGAWLRRARGGELEEMIERGFGHAPIDGFRVVARDLAELRLAALTRANSRTTR
jgi:hypothetical protein